MSGPDELDRALAQLRAEREPTPEIQGRVYAGLLANLGDGGGDGEGSDGEGWDELPDAPEPTPSEGLGGAASGKAAALHVVKIIGATAAMTAGGLLVLALGARVLPRSDAPSEPRASIEAPARSDAPEPNPEPAASAPAPARAERAEPSRDSERAPAKQARPRLERAPPADTQTPLQTPDSLAAEVAMLDAARRTPAGPRRLAKLHAHAQRFPAGALADERDALWAITSCELGALDAGRARARALIERRPQSPLLPRVRAVCPGLPKAPAQN